MIENEKIVKVSFELYIQGEQEGQEAMIHRSTEEQPLVYCQGENMMLPTFEARLAGKEAGEAFDFVVPCAEAYGEYDERGVKELPKQMFYNGDGEFDEEHVYEGSIIPMNTDDGWTVNAEVISVTDDKVTIDLNHPLAGEDLHFKGKILAVRDASPEELEAIRHPHHCCGKKGKCGNNGGCKKNNKANNCNCDGEHSCNCGEA